jgi:hypothetical protein
MDGAITLTPEQAATIRRALLMSLERANDLEHEMLIVEGYRLLHPTTPPASVNGGQS